jgi:hypothetical protein
MNKANYILWKCFCFYKLAALNPFDKPLAHRGWDENIGDHHVWNVMLNEVPILLDMKGDEQALREWTAALQLRMGISPKFFPEIKDIVRQLWEKDLNSLSLNEYTEEYGKLILFLRQYAYTDPVWIENNTYNASTYTDEF